jgi:hypothetical protein
VVPHQSAVQKGICSLPKVSETKETVVVFGSRLIADNWARANGYAPAEVILATRGPEALKGVKGPIRTVRVSEDLWRSSTLPDDKRLRDMEAEIKTINKLRKMHDSVATKEKK